MQARAACARVARRAPARTASCALGGVSRQLIRQGRARAGRRRSLGAQAAAAAAERAALEGDSADTRSRLEAALEAEHAAARELAASLAAESEQLQHAERTIAALTKKAAAEVAALQARAALACTHLANSYSGRQAAAASHAVGAPRC